MCVARAAFALLKEVSDKIQDNLRAPVDTVVPLSGMLYRP
jgi:hypothetical protein